MRHAGACPPFPEKVPDVWMPCRRSDQAVLIERATQHLLRVVVIDDAGTRRWANMT
jgi:hypothetical protein